MPSSRLFEWASNRQLSRATEIPLPGSEAAISDGGFNKVASEASQKIHPALLSSLEKHKMEFHPTPALSKSLDSLELALSSPIAGMSHEVARDVSALKPLVGNSRDLARDMTRSRDHRQRGRPYRSARSIQRNGVLG